MAEIVRAGRGHRSTIALAAYVARRDLARRYAGSGLGALWAVAFPVLQISVYWAVAHYGLRLEARDGVPIGVMLLAGMTPWFALSEALAGMTQSFTANASLLKRLVVPPAILPLASLIAAGMVHAVILLAATLLLWAAGYPPAPRFAALLYYAACGALFALAAGTLLALANVALRDVGQMIAPLLLLWFWATPIVWPAEALPQHLHWAVTWNPVAFLVDGYRHALLGPAHAAPGREATIAFWTISAGLSLAAWLAFRRFERALADHL
jgi:teichoic acid transport system permease protein